MASAAKLVFSYSSLVSAESKHEAFSHTAAQDTEFNLNFGVTVLDSSDHFHLFLFLQPLKRGYMRCRQEISVIQ